MSDAWMVPNIPAMGGGGIVSFGNSGLGNAQQQYGQNQNYFGQQQQALGAANAYNPWANTPGGFGAQTAYYAGQGAAYGRAVQPKTASVFETGAKPYNDYGNSSLGAGQPNYFSGSTPISPMVGPANDPASMAYYKANPDVAASGMNAYDHWQSHGQAEGRQSFGVENVGAGKGMDWNSYFNSITSGGDGPEAEYLLANPDVAAAAQRAGGDVNAFAAKHYQEHGRDEGRKFFDANAYYQQNPDVWESGANPFQHYNQFGRNEGRAAPTTTFDSRWYGEQNPDVIAAGMDPAAHWFQFGQNEGRFGSNPLVAQRNDYAERIRNDPNLSLQLAARLYSEDQNNPDTRVGIAEAMMNRLAATKQDPLNLSYYPKDQTAYNRAFEKVSSDNDLLNQIHQEMERAFGGSNLSNYATDWASAGVADNARSYATPTWTSPTNEQFFRKDLNNPTTGAGIAAQNKRWYDSVTKSVWPK